MYCYYLWLLFIFSPAAYTQTTDKYTDENRPYKFGFNIQGYQHRQEQKDEKGIIKGEYGFITADGYYRVTVYATDENGDFRIISMKNYYVGFPPENPTTTPGSPTASQGGGAGFSLFGGVSGVRTEEGGRGPIGTTRGSTGIGREPIGTTRGSTGIGREPIGTSAPQKQPVRPQGLSACSDCYVPTTTRKPLLSFTGGGAGKDAVGGTFSLGGGPGASQERKAFDQEQGGRERFPGPINLNNIPDFSNASPRPNFEKKKTSQLQSPKSFGGFGGSPGTSGSLGTSGTPGAPAGPGAPGSQYFGGNNPQRPNIPGGGFFGSNKRDPVQDQVDAIQNNRLDNDQNRKPQIGEVRDGLPPGVPLSAIKDLLLYRFNYTVGFHGHHEDGYRSGDKEGDYFFDGRDGVERKVEYLANEFGYQPNITLIDLQENDVRRPKEETEKEFGLKGYEFKWFYRK